MKVIVKLFGSQAVRAGRRDVEIDVGDHQATCAQLRKALAAAAPALAATLPASRLAVNHTFADEAALIGPGDEVALIGMVGGG